MAVIAGQGRRAGARQAGCWRAVRQAGKQTGMHGGRQAGRQGRGGVSHRLKAVLALAGISGIGHQILHSLNETLHLCKHPGGARGQSGRSGGQAGDCSDSAQPPAACLPASCRKNGCKTQMPARHPRSRRMGGEALWCLPGCRKSLSASFGAPLCTRRESRRSWWRRPRPRLRRHWFGRHEAPAGGRRAGVGWCKQV